jgi:hypothetical protein
MSEELKDRQRPPCHDCGALLYDKFWGNGGWVPTEQFTGKAHGPEDCVVMLKAQLLAERALPKVRPGHHPPCPAMLDSEAVCTCGQ